MLDIIMITSQCDYQKMNKGWYQLSMNIFLVLTDVNLQYSNSMIHHIHLMEYWKSYITCFFSIFRLHDITF